MNKWLKTKDGCNILLKNKSEIGTFYIPERGVDYNQATPYGEYTPEHVHYNYLYTDAYEKSGKARGKE